MKRSRSHEEDEKADMKKMKKRSRSAVQQAQDALHELQAMRKKPENADLRDDNTPCPPNNNAFTLFYLAASQMASKRSYRQSETTAPQTGQEFPLEVEASDTIKNVKAKIQVQSSSSMQEQCIPPEKQTVISEQDDTQLAD